MLCPRCGYYTDNEDTVCPECGEILNTGAGEPSGGAEAIRQGKRARQAIRDAAMKQNAEARRKRRSGASHATVEMPAVQDERDDIEFASCTVSEADILPDEDDGEQVFVHINCQGILHYLKDEHSIIFSTKPLDDNLFWFNFPLNTLISFKDGKVLFKGESHGKEYIPTCEQLWAVSDFILSMQDDNSEGELNFDRSDLKSLKYRFI